MTTAYNHRRVTFVGRSLCLGLASLVVWGQAHAATIQLGAINVTTGTTFSVPVTIDSGASPLGSYLVKVNFDPNLLRFNGVLGGAGAFSNAPVVNLTTNDVLVSGVLNTNLNGALKFNHAQLASTNSPTGKTTVSQLSFTALSTNGTSSILTLSDLEILDTDGNAMSATPINGFASIGIFPPGDLNGSFTFNIADLTLLNNLILKPASVTNVAGGATTGDLNRSGAVNIADLVILNGVVLNTVTNRTTRILPASRPDGTAQSAIIYGLRITSNTVTGASIGAPVGLTLTNVQPLGTARVTAVIPAGGGAGIGSVSLVATPAATTNYARFTNP